MKNNVELNSRIYVCGRNGTIERCLLLHLTVSQKINQLSILSGRYPDEQI